MRRFIESTFFTGFIIGLICVDSIALGLLCLPYFAHNAILLKIDEICLYVFVLEMSLKLIVLRKDFFKNGWNSFDLLIVCLSALPLVDLGNILILRFYALSKSLESSPMCRS